MGCGLRQPGSALGSARRWFDYVSSKIPVLEFNGQCGGIKRRVHRAQEWD